MKRNSAENGNKLKPCPFCGSEPLIRHDFLQVGNKMVKGYYIGCPNTQSDCCSPTTWTFRCKKEAIEVWNRRTGEE